MQIVDIKLVFTAYIHSTEDPWQSGPCLTRHPLKSDITITKIIMQIYYKYINSSMLNLENN